MWKTGQLAAITLVGVPALLGITSCSNDSDSVDSAPAPSPVGHVYISTEVQGPPIPGGGPLELGFTDDDKATLDAGCNTATAGVDLSDGRFAVTDLESTTNDCSAETIGADAWVTDLLQKQPTWTLDGATLTLTAGNQIVTLTRK
ncbi:META domain-containing protein [Aldersonia sp. NBC_00410]|jgi:heat shock protein HslJ|uniref:META domain-containing protein n=1 Tax=Aldersonia sp. NBC_00410 TaxID=2975954 RepID=UPI0022598957|nr:META domain-containing protein [Aldersonia sp. NBC_00410]MCX5044810.1 META domain-containing protein [Aldersonia sp. NBC_00410]